MQLLLWTQVLLLTSASTLIRPQPNRNAAFTPDHVSQTLDSLEKLLQYFDKNRGSLIVDSMWAIRMIQGQSIYAICSRIFFELRINHVIVVFLFAIFRIYR